MEKAALRGAAFFFWWFLRNGSVGLDNPQNAPFCSRRRSSATSNWRSSFCMPSK